MDADGDGTLDWEELQGRAKNKPVADTLNPEPQTHKLELYRGFIGIMEKKMETTIMGLL